MNEEFKQITEKIKNGELTADQVTGMMNVLDKIMADENYFKNTATNIILNALTNELVKMKDEIDSLLLLAVNDIDEIASTQESIKIMFAMAFCQMSDMDKYSKETFAIVLKIYETLYHDKDFTETIKQIDETVYTLLSYKIVDKALLKFHLPISYDILIGGTDGLVKIHDEGIIDMSVEECNNIILELLWGFYDYSSKNARILYEIYVFRSNHCKNSDDKRINSLIINYYLGFIAEGISSWISENDDIIERYIKLAVALYGFSIHCDEVDDEPDLLAKGELLEKSIRKWIPEGTDEFNDLICRFYYIQGLISYDANQKDKAINFLEKSARYGFEPAKDSLQKYRKEQEGKPIKKTAKNLAISAPFFLLACVASLCGYFLGGGDLSWMLIPSVIFGVTAGLLSSISIFEFNEYEYQDDSNEIGPKYEWSSIIARIGLLRFIAVSAGGAFGLPIVCLALVHFFTGIFGIGGNKLN